MTCGNGEVRQELPEFMHASDEIAYSETHQANLLEMLRLDPGVLDYAE